MTDQLGDVYQEHVASVWRYVRARLPGDADAEDVTSDVFMRAARSWAHYDPARGTTRAWLAGIARHAVFDWWRNRADEVAVDDAATGLAASDDPEEAALRLDATMAIRRHLHLLTDKERDAIALRFGADLSSTEVGALLGVSDTAARMLVYRAVSKLREVLDRD